ncbi:MAG: alpha-mannosidase [Clostridiales bacterium]|nr:alpha-mannosidase [Clostridiales bacterium]
MLKNKIFLIGNAHLDPVWLWRKTEGYAEIKATFRSALDIMKEFPDYVFTASSAAYYKWIEESEPHMFEEIKQRVEEGRWVIAGGLWVQPDCNIPNGESFARHLLYSQRYFLEKFGHIAKFGYNVDSFGHNGMLPQLLKHGGIESYVFMRPDKIENPELPTGLFNWQSPDGSSVLTFRLTTGYGDGNYPVDRYPQFEGLTKYEARALDVLEQSVREGIPLMSFYGVGNHGGGPTVRHLSALEEIIAKDPEKFEYAGPGKYFDYVRKVLDTENLPTVKTDLQHHASGCYAANSEVKRRNRKSENLLMAAEKYDWLASRLTDSKPRSGELSSAWERVLFNQFHDIVTGCSIRSAYEEAFNSYGYACDVAWEVGNFALQKISWRVNTKALFEVEGKEDGESLFAQNGEGEPSVVFNPHSFPVQTPVYIPYVSKGVCDDRGRPIPFQTVRAEKTNGLDNYETMIMAEIPAYGWATHYVYRKEKLAEAPPALPSVEADDNVLENDLVRIEFDKHTGWVKSYFDKAKDREMSAGPMAKPLIIRDDATDTWSHAVFEFREELGAFTDAQIKVLENGPIRAAIRVISYYNKSKLVQDFYLYAGSKKLEVRALLHFAEELKILKLSFPFAGADGKVAYSMPNGFIYKEADGLEEASQAWLSLSDGRGAGLALLNDSKYSFDVKGDDIRMAVARGCGYADHFGVRDDLMEFQDQGEQIFNYTLMPHEAGAFAQVVKEASLLNTPPELVRETHHDGPLPTSYEGIRISAENCLVQTLKYAHTGSATVIRLYETAGLETEVSVEIAALDVKFETNLKAQEIKTFLIEESGQVKESNFLEL